MNPLPAGPLTSQRDNDATRRELTTRTLAVRAAGIDESARSFEAVAATESRALVFDWMRGEAIEEVLVADGCDVGEQVPLLDSHMRWTSLDQIGSSREYRRDGNTWICRNFLVSGDQEVERIWLRIKQRHLRDVSIGYEVLEYVDIPARQTQRVAGRDWTAGDRTLRVTTKWRIRELSVTPIGADQQAKIRSQLGVQVAPNLRSMSMNPRLLAYIRKLMGNPNATEQECREHMATLRGVERTLANILDYPESDAGARSTVDLAIRSLGHDPEQPWSLLPTTQTQPQGGERTATSGSGVASVVAPPAGGHVLTPEQARSEGARLERERQSQLREMASTIVPAEVLQRAINEGWTIERAGPVFLQHIRDSREAPLSADVPGRAPAGHSRNSQSDYTRDSLAAALMLREGVNDPTRAWPSFHSETGTIRRRNLASDQAIGRAVDRGHEMGRLSMVEIVRRALEADGVRCEPDAVSIGRALQQRGAAAMSNSVLVGVFTQTYGAVMLDAYEQTADTTAGWTIERENPNFLQNERHRMERAAALTRHAKGGTANDVKIGEAGPEYTRIFRYSGQFTIDEIDLINDTFGALNDYTPQEMGEAARRLRPDIVYYILISNPTMRDGVALFHATHANLVAAGGALAKATLEALTNKIAVQQENGINLNLQAKYLILPTALQFTGRELVRSQTVVARGGTDAIIPSANALVDQGFEVVTDPRLDNGVTDPVTGTTAAGDVSDWYLACAGSRHTIEVTYLRGSSRSPQIRSGVLDKGQFGLWFDVKQDIGGKALDWRGVGKSVAP